MRREYLAALGVGLAICLIMLFQTRPPMSHFERPAARICAPSGECVDVTHEERMADWVFYKQIGTIGRWSVEGISPYLMIDNHNCGLNDCTISILYNQAGTSKDDNDLISNDIAKRPRLETYRDRWVAHYGLSTK